MKINSKKFIKRRILPAIASVVVFCLVVLLIVATRKTEASADNDKVSVGTKEYTVDNPMTILEIVPENYYDFLGPMVGRYDTANSDPNVITWDKLIANCPSGKTNKDNITKYLMDCVGKYVRSMESALGDGAEGYAPVVMINGQDLGCLDNSYTVGLALEGINYKITKDNTKIAYCIKKGYNKTSEYLSSDVRDIFSYLVFGGTEAQDKVQVRVKKAQNVTEDDIKEAGFIYMASTLPDYMKNVYKAYNPSKYGSDTTINWEDKVDGVSVDLRPSAAIELLYENAREGKPLIFVSSDKASASNKGKVLNIINGIENDYLIRDFMRTKLDKGVGYSGKRGSIYANGDTSNDPIYMTLDGEQLEFSSIMFMAMYNIPTDGAGYYPAYNCTTQRTQDKLRRNSLVFNAGNQITQKLSTDNHKDSWRDSKDLNYDYNGNHFYGSYYEDVFKKLGKDIKTDNIKTYDAIRYIFGTQDTSTMSDVKVLEVEPYGYYRYLTDTDERKAKTEKIIKSWFGVGSEDTSVSVTVDHVSMNGFNGMNVDLAAEYDLIIIGTYGQDKVKVGTDGNLMGLSNIYSDTTDVSAYGLTPDNAALNGNDMTEKMYNNLYDYALRGLPLVLDEDMYMGDGDIADSDTIISKKMQLDGIVYDILEKNNGNATTRNITYIKEGTNDLSKNVIYVDKVANGIVADKSNYSDTKTSYTLAENATDFIVNFSGSLPAGNYRIKVYMDINQDGIFADQIGDEQELFCYDDSLKNKSESAITRDMNGCVYGKYVSLSSDGTYSMSVSLPASAKGYFSWKTEVIEVDDANSNPAYYPKSVNTGAFAIKGTESTVRVLQITGTTSSAGSLDLKNDEAFIEKFNSVNDITGLNLHVTQMSQDDLNKKYNKRDSAGNIQTKAEIADIVKDLETYSMIVLGFEGNYGTKSILDDNISDAINKYIDDGYSIMFTFDTVSPLSTVSDNNYAGKSVKDYSYLRTDTVKYLSRLDLKRQFTDPFLFKLARTDGAGKTAGKLEASPYGLNTEVDESLLSKYGYNGTIRNLLKKNMYIKTTTTDIESNKASELNAGQVTSYPYKISENIPYLAGNSITIAETHAQYFALNLEKDSSLYDENGILNPQPVVWYTFAKSFDNNYCGASNDGQPDTNAARNLYYSVTDKDAMNNYYIYSYGNVTYTAAGHDKITSDSELELFVNTFTKAILSGKHAPTVTYTDAKIDDTVTEYTSYIKTMYSKFVSNSLEFKFRIDYLSNFYRIKDVYMYIDLNNNGAYDEESDVGLGYIDAKRSSTGTDIKLKDSSIEVATKIVPGVEYTIDDFWTLIDNDNIRPKLTAKGTDIDALKRALKNGTLNIGIKATSDQIVKGENVSGYSVLNFQLKDLFDLD